MPRLQLHLRTLMALVAVVAIELAVLIALTRLVEGMPFNAGRFLVAAVIMGLLPGNVMAWSSIQLMRRSSPPLLAAQVVIPIAAGMLLLEARLLGLILLIGLAADAGFWLLAIPIGLYRTVRPSRGGEGGRIARAYTRLAPFAINLAIFALIVLTYWLSAAMGA